jgi:NAD(P)-dependent dehydrogenase (short-subunit alcohol dehydrogenase family)
MDIQGKVAIVTGGGSGIGRASALRLAKEGASVVVADVSADGGHATVHNIDASGGKATYCRVDVTSEADLRSAIALAEETYGGLDILHNNAGIITGQPAWPDTEVERWSRMVDINLRGVILGTQLALPAMRKRGGGGVVNTASLAGIGFGYAPNPVYAATKGGVVLFTASLAPLAEEANIRVNCVCPGVVDTPMLRGLQGEMESDDASSPLMERLREFPVLQPEDIADAVVHLIRDDSLAGRAYMLRNGMPPELLRQAGNRPAGT